MDNIQQIFFPTFALAYSLLHFIFYFNNRKIKSLLYFSLFLLFFGITTFVDWFNLTNPTLLNLTLHRFFLPITQVLMLLFTYSVYDFKKPRYFPLIIAGFIITGGLAVYNPVKFFDYQQIMIILNMVEMARVFNAAVMAKKRGAQIIAVGFTLLLLFSIYDLLLDFKLMAPLYNIENGYPFGFILMIIFMSIYLARDYAWKHQKMIDEQRKSRELDEARALQQAMLPSSCDLNGLDNCFYIQPATEIGGDYYDYRVEPDDSLTIAIGDATGHGLKAGIMVSIMKSLFISNPQMPFEQFFNTCNKTLRAMRLGNLYMAMQMVRLENNQITACSAGMPFALIYRAKNNILETLESKGMPLGATASYPYQTVKSRVTPGDVVLLMSDGLMELFNADKQVFGEERIKSLFIQHAHRPANQIIQEFCRAAKTWRKDYPQNDDITLIVFKI